MPPTAWNLFVKKIYHQVKAKNSEYQFKQALKDASKRKSEMGNSGTEKHGKHKSKKSRSKNVSLAGGRKSRKRRSRRH